MLEVYLGHGVELWFLSAYGWVRGQRDPRGRVPRLRRPLDADGCRGGVLLDGQRGAAAQEQK